MSASRTTRPSVSGTRERILYEASQLFARHGYRGTTTRDIARAVGIQQPSLFHHFASKDAILQALLSWDLDLALPMVRRISRQPDPPSVRLHRYLRADAEHLATAPYNLSGLYTEEVMTDPTFTPWAHKRARLHGVVEGIVREGMEAGEFVRMSPALVREAVAGILVRTLTLYSGGRGAGRELGDEVAGFVLRALLAEPDRLAEIQALAAADGQAIPASNGS